MSFRALTSSFLKKPSKSPPPEETNQEAEYLKSLGERQRPVAIKLLDGEVVRGWIEYYDQNMVRLTREGAPNLFIFKHEIVYIAEETGHPNRPKAGQPEEARRPAISGNSTRRNAPPQQPAHPRLEGGASGHAARHAGGGDASAENPRPTRARDDE